MNACELVWITLARNGSVLTLTKCVGGGSAFGPFGGAMSGSSGDNGRVCMGRFWDAILPHCRLAGVVVALVSWGYAVVHRAGGGWGVETFAGDNFVGKRGLPVEAC